MKWAPVLFGLRQREMKPAKGLHGSQTPEGKCVGRGAGRWPTAASPLPLAHEEHARKPGEPGRDWRTWCASSETQNPRTLSRKNQALTQRKAVKVHSLSRTGEGRPRGTNSCQLSSESAYASSLPGGGIPVEFQTIGQWIHGQKSRDCLLSGDRETQGTDSTVPLKSEKRFSARICGCFLVLGGQGWVTSQKR